VRDPEVEQWLGQMPPISDHLVGALQQLATWRSAAQAVCDGLEELLVELAHTYAKATVLLLHLAHQHATNKVRIGWACMRMD
jgi:hypothetical protein